MRGLAAGVSVLGCHGGASDTLLGNGLLIVGHLPCLEHVSLFCVHQKWWLAPVFNQPLHQTDHSYHGLLYAANPVLEHLLFGGHMVLSVTAGSGCH